MDIRQNNFGLLRLFFALCVLISHSFELIDGNRSREPLTRLFGTLSSGELGVDGFFLISGYLITQSFEGSGTVASYLTKRILRIYPAFLVAFALSVFVVAPLAGADLSTLRPSAWRRLLGSALILSQPVIPNVFSGLHYPALDGPMWTISYEFRCYLIVIGIGLAGLFRTRISLALVTLASLIVLASGRIDASYSTPLPMLTGLPRDTIRLLSLFLVGSTFYVFRDRISYRNDLALLSVVMLIAGLFNRSTAEAAVALFGGYLVFWLAFLKNTPNLNRVNNRNLDLSYGIYLTAWPIQNLVIRYFSFVEPFELIIVTSMGSLGLAWLSWTFIEAPCLNLKDRFTSRACAATT